MVYILPKPSVSLLIITILCLWIIWKNGSWPSEIEMTYNIRKQQTRLYWVCSWELMESATILMPPSTGLSSILLSVSPPPEKSQKYRVSWQYWSVSSEKSQSYQASIQCWANISTPAKQHLNGVSLVGRWWPAYSGYLDPSSPHHLKKNAVKVGPPLAKLSASTYEINNNSI